MVVNSNRCLLSAHSSSLSRSLRRPWAVPVFLLWWSREAVQIWTAWTLTQRKPPSIEFIGCWRAPCLERAGIRRYGSHWSVFLIFTLISFGDNSFSFYFRLRERRALKLLPYKNICLFCSGRWRRCASSCWRRTQPLSWLKIWTALLVRKPLLDNESHSWRDRLKWCFLSSSMWLKRTAQ